MGIELHRRPVNRRFFVILALSLLLHGSLLLWQMTARKQAPVLPTLIATLRLTAVSAPHEPLRAATVTPVTRTVPAVPPKVRPSSARPVVAPPRERITTAAPTPETVLATPPAIPVAVAPVAPPAPAAMPTAVASASPAASPAAPAAEAANQRDLLAAYRRQLGELFSRHQTYPRIAALRGWEGEVRVRLKVARKGSLIGIQLDRSSGFDVLDRHALAMLGDLPGLPALPEGLSSDELQLVVPISYKLNKTT
ncbi:MAG: energy transducer TonB [Azonexus sp.]|nr:energy transducer TonB [Azonexus sp.]